MGIPLKNVPEFNAACNAAAGVLAAGGYLFIRRGRVLAHKVFMLSAVACSGVFLAGYLYYHFNAGIVHYRGAGAARIAYFSILTSHTLLAALTAPLVLYTASLALRGKFDRHRWWAKRALPIWIYVSVTGAVIYGMLFGF